MALSHSSKDRKPALVNEIQRMARVLGRPPTAHDLPEHGKIGRDMFESVFGSWLSALEAAGYEPDYRQYSTEDLVEQLRQLGDELDHVPRRDDMREHGQFGSSVYESRFNSWNEALRKAGFEPVQVHGIDREDLISAIDALADELGRPPTRNEMRVKGKYGERPFRRVFGSWNNSLRAAGYEPNLRRDITDSDLLDAIVELSSSLNKVPTATEMSEHGRYYVPTFQDQFGSWNNAIQAAGYEPRVKGNGISALYGPGWTGTKRKKVRERDGQECWSCEIDSKDHQMIHGSELHVHHIRPAREFPDYHPLANASENLITLCAVCHKHWEEDPNLVPEGESLPSYCRPTDPTASVRLSDYLD